MFASFVQSCGPAPFERTGRGTTVESVGSRERRGIGVDERRRTHMKTIYVTPEEIMREATNMSCLVLLSNETLDWVSGPLYVDGDRLIVEAHLQDGGISAYYDVLGSILDIYQVLRDSLRQKDNFTIVVAESPHEFIGAFLIRTFDALIYEGVTFGPLHDNDNARWTSTEMKVRHTKEDGLWVAISNDPLHLVARLR